MPEVRPHENAQPGKGKRRGSHMEDTPRLRLWEAWGPWLQGHQWSHWATLTFRPPRPREGLGKARPYGHKRVIVGPSEQFAHEAFADFIRRLDNPRVPTVAWFRGDEFGRAGRRHMHALLGGRLEGLPEGSGEQWITEQWRHGWAKVDRYDPERGAGHYVAKYVTKDMGDYALGGPIRQRPVPRDSL